MIHLQDRYLAEDLALLRDNPKIPWSRFSGKSVLVTGATGLIGSLLIKSILFACDASKIPVKVYGLVRSLEKTGNIYQGFSPTDLSCCTLDFILGDVTQEFGAEKRFDYILHTASPTGSRFFVTKPVETIQSIVMGTDNLLQLALRSKVSGMVYISSMEAFGSVDADHAVREEEIGQVPLHAPRSSYPEGKRMSECLCSAYASEYGVPVCTARLAQTFGAGVLPTEKRVFAQFARSVLQREDIVLHTKGNSEGNYCYSRDVVAAILTLLFSGDPGAAYTVVNEDSHTTIRAMAEMLAHEVANDEIRVVFDIPDDASTYGYAPDVKLRLSGEKMRSLGWQPEVGLKEAYTRMLGSMRDQKVV